MILVAMNYWNIIEMITPLLGNQFFSEMTSFLGRCHLGKKNASKLGGIFFVVSIKQYGCPGLDSNQHILANAAT